MIQTELACIGCGYNLRGLERTGRCPECGALIDPSLRGDLLGQANPEWLEKLRLGTSLNLWNIAFLILGGVLVNVLKAVGVPPIADVIFGLAGGVLGLWASWAITTQEPRISLQEDPITLRKVIRVFALTAFLGGVIANIEALAHVGMALSILGMVLSLSGLVSEIGELVYYRRFAMRIPDQKLAKSIKMLMWLLPVALMLVFLAAFLVTVMSPAGAATTGPSAAMSATFGFVACFAGLSFLVVLLWYVRLLTKFSRAFKTAISEARSKPVVIENPGAIP